MLNETLLADFRAAHDVLEALRVRLHGELESLLQHRHIQVHLVSSRLKTESSLRQKLARPDRTYQALFDVTDLVGLRVTTYFEDHVDEVARAVEEHFAVDYAQSTDKRRIKEHGRFGYRSLHYVCGLRTADAPLPANFRFEIQLRTVLQHAWAEVEHDLGYKAAESVPAAIRHRFSRVAGLLELADEEFLSIRRELESYAKQLETDVHAGAGVMLDAVALGVLSKSAEVAALDAQVARSIEKPQSEQLFSPEYLVRLLHLSGLGTTAAIQQALKEHGAAAVGLVKPYFHFSAHRWQQGAGALERVQRGYGLFFLAHAAVLNRSELGLDKVTQLTQLYRSLDYPNDERAARAFASELVAALAGRTGA